MTQRELTEYTIRVLMDMMSEFALESLLVLDIDNV